MNVKRDTVRKEHSRGSVEEGDKYFIQCTATSPIKKWCSKELTGKAREGGQFP